MAFQADDRLTRLPASADSPPAGLLWDAGRLGAHGRLDWLRPEAYGERAHPVGAEGGRGSAWFVTGDAGDAVLRRYRRGGLFGRLVHDRYVWQGVESTRCVREYRLLRALHAQQLPVPAPLAAGWWRQGLTYRQALLTARIPNAESLAGRLARNMHVAPWDAAGAMIARFHLVGVDHADLNAHNILVDADERLWLIDFDRGSQGAHNAKVGESNLQRLRRSLNKIGGPAGEAGWQRLYAAWQQALARGTAA